MHQEKNKIRYINTMVAEKDIIVALELATTCIRAIAGQRMPDSTMHVLAFAEENASNCIRKGVIDNIDKTTQAISRVLGQISLQLGQSISRIYVGLGGQSLHSVQNRIQRSFSEKTKVTNRIIDQLMDMNRGVVYTDSQILEVIPQEYKAGSRAVPDIVGMQVEQLEATFQNIVARSSLAENIEKCIRGAGFEIAELLIAPISLGSSVLNASEKRSGCALVDIGADTTTVSMYTNNILRKLVVIPLGGNNATMDIATCLNIEIEEAESLKQKYGRAFLEDYEAIQHNIVKFSHDREIGESRLCDIIEARYEEILRNVWAQVEDDSDKLTSGIILTGGGAQIRSITEALQYITNSSKQIRIVKGLPKDITIAAGIYIPDNSKANGILSLLLHGDQNCVLHRVKPLNPDPDDETTEDDTTEETDITEEGTKPEVQTKNKKKSITDFFKIIAESLKEDE